MKHSEIPFLNHSSIQDLPCDGRTSEAWSATCPQGKEHCLSGLQNARMRSAHKHCRLSVQTHQRVPVKEIWKSINHKDVVLAYPDSVQFNLIVRPPFRPGGFLVGWSTNQKSTVT